MFLRCRRLRANLLFTEVPASYTTRTDDSKALNEGSDCLRLSARRVVTFSCLATDQTYPVARLEARLDPGVNH
ncbi:hypothetical protein AOLI_G00295770 [Acnodon oligacanthus]